MSKFMRLIVFFDIPTKTKKDRRCAYSFRKFLLNDGYCMLQYSVYVRVCNGMDAVREHEGRLNENLPETGSVRMLVLTDKQYSSMKILVGTTKKEEKGSINLLDII